MHLNNALFTFFKRYSNYFHFFCLEHKNTIYYIHTHTQDELQAKIKMKQRERERDYKQCMLHSINLALISLLMVTALSTESAKTFFFLFHITFILYDLSTVFYYFFFLWFLVW